MMWDSDVRSNGFLIQHTVISLIISTLSVTTFHRNMLWEDELSLWKDVTIRSPRKARGYNNSGAFYRDRGLLDEAINEYVSAAKYSYSIIYKKIIYKNLGTAFAEKGLVDEALKSYKEVLKIDPADGDSLYNMGFLYAKMGLPDMAIRFYADAVRVNPDDLGARQELERLLNSRVGIAHPADFSLNTRLDGE